MNHPVSKRIYELRGGSPPRKPSSIKAKDISPGEAFSGPDWEVHADTVRHAEPWLDSLAYRVETESGSIVLTRDTKRC